MSVHGSRQEPDLRDEESRAEPGFMLIILNAPTISHLLDSLIALVRSGREAATFSILARTLY